MRVKKSILTTILCLTLTATMCLPAIAAEAPDAGINETTGSAEDTAINAAAENEAQLPAPEAAPAELPEETEAANDTFFIASDSAGPEDPDVIHRTGGVTQEMCSPDYWKSRTPIDADEVLMTADEIRALNDACLGAPDLGMYDLEKIKSPYDADALRLSLSQISRASGIYVNNEPPADENAYYDAIANAILDTGYTDTEKELQYAVAIRRTEIRIIPTTDFVGYGLNDTDNEIVDSCLDVNEPFVIAQCCEYNGVLFYWGYSNNCTGWILAEDLAICADKNEWLGAWKVGLADQDFIVVTQDRIRLEESDYTPYSSGVVLNMGTILKLVPQELIPATIADRSPTNNYLVYLPTRTPEGKYEAKMALIPEHHSVSVGFLPLTQAHILDAAFSCLGNRYGWGNMAGSWDCSGFTRIIYSIFGLQLPRNTIWQKDTPGANFSIEGMSLEQKEQLMETLPAGTMLFLKGHIVFLLGSENGKSYAIGANGAYYDSEGPMISSQVMGITVAPTSVRRADGRTWMEHFTRVICPFGFRNLGDCTIEVNYDRALDLMDISVKDEYTELKEGINYTLTMTEDPATGIKSLEFTGINNYYGTNYAVVDPSAPCAEHTSVTDPGFDATCISPGLTEGSHCAVCGEILQVQTVIPAYGHDWEEKYTVDKVPTETEAGSMSIHCRRCNAIKNSTPLPASGKTDPGNKPSDKPSGSGTGTDSTEKTQGKDVKSGDSSHLGIWIILLMGCMATSVFCVKRRR